MLMRKGAKKMTNLPEKSRLADLHATGDYSLRELLLIEYHNVIAIRQRGTSWSKIAAASGSASRSGTARLVSA
jgi:hypothetical protein